MQTDTERSTIHDDRSRGERAADHVASFMGSWRFIIGQNICLVIWACINFFALFHLHWDPYPFILLNLLLSFQASNAAPVIMMSQNRQAAKDRERDDQEADQVKSLLSIIRGQTRTLDEIRRLATRLEDHIGGDANG